MQKYKDAISGSQGSEILLRGLTGEIAALRLGNRQGRPVLALHGWLDNAASFLPLSHCLSDYDWVSIDFPGHGRSDHRPTDCIYHLTDYVADVLSVVNDLGWQQFDLVGHSLGAGIGSIFTAACPQRVKKLVLIDGIGPLSGKQDETLGQLRKAMVFQENYRQKQPRGYDSWGQLIENRLAAGKMNVENAEFLVRRAADESEGQIFVRSDQRLKQPSLLYMSQQQVCSILKGIQCPTLLIQALSGFLITRPTTEQRIESIADISVVGLEGHHHLHMDDPDAVAARIRPFLE